MAPYFSTIHPAIVLTAPSAPTRIHSIRRSIPFDRPFGIHEKEFILEALPTIPRPYSFKRFGEIITCDETIYWPSPVGGVGAGCSH